MPLSGSVTAGSAALASQYNNLRADVLNTSTGHTHTGASENGARVEGTAIASTGATAGYVLTAGAGGTTTTWAAVQSDQGTFATATVNFSFAGANDYFTRYVGTAGSASYMSGGGTILSSYQIFAGVVSPWIMRTWVIPAHTADSTATTYGSANMAAVAGSADDIYMLDSNGAPGTAIYWLELDYNGYAQNINYLRKYKADLTTSIWNANLGTAFDPDLPNGHAESSMPFSYYSGINAWIGAMYNPYMDAGTARVFLVNDTSGSVYSATFGTNAVNNRWTINSYAYVPPVGTALGTAYVWGYRGASKRLVTFTVGSASITALSTAENWSPLPTAVSTSGLYAAYWDSQINKLVVNAGTGSSTSLSNNYYGIERTGGTLIWTSASSATIRSHARYGDYSVGKGIGVFGPDSTSYAPQSVLLPSTEGTGYVTPVFATNGTLTAFAYGGGTGGYGNYMDGGTATTRAIAYKRKANGTLGTASFGRIFWSSGATSLSVVATTVNDSYTMATGLNYLPAGGTYTRVATDATATGTVSDTLYTLQMK